jgi:ketosteroid isomerase-like protein
MNAAEHRQLLGTLAELLGTQQYDRLDEVYAADAVTEYPQSGERFRGIESLRGQFANYPGLERGTTEFEDVIGGDTYALTPMYTVVAVDGSGDRGTALFRTRYPDGTLWWVINVYELDGGRIARTRVFFAPEFEAPEWRAPYWDKT